MKPKRFSVPACLAWLLVLPANSGAADAPGWSPVLEERFADEGYKQRWSLEGEADLQRQSEGGQRFLRIQTLQSARDQKLHHSVLWYRERLQGDLRFVFRARGQRGNGTIFYFNARPPAGSAVQSIFDSPRPDALEERYSASQDFEAYTFGYLRSPELHLRHVGGATAAAWPRPWNKENSARYDQESMMRIVAPPFGERCDEWHDFDISVVGDRISIQVDGKVILEHTDTGRSPQGTIAWTPLRNGGWTGFRNFVASWVDVAFFRVYRPAPAAEAGRGSGRLRMEEDFSRGLADWWTEGGETHWVEAGRLHMKADNPKIGGGGAATAWWKLPHPADFDLTLDAHVVSSSIEANNINLFFCYSDPAGKPLFDTRESRRTADYNLYHQLNGYIVTFLNDANGEGGRNSDGSTKARVRIRRNPGFQLLNETFTKQCRAGVTYQLSLSKRGGHIRFAVDGETLLEADDPEPWQGGLLGLRTYRTFLWWDNLRLTPVETPLELR